MIEWIVTSSVLILLVLVLRRMIRERVSPRLRYALWGLVLLRLLVPGTIFESRASVMTPVAAQKQYQAMARIPAYSQTAPDGWVETGNPDIPEAQIQTVTYGRPPAEDELESLQKQVHIRNALLFVWLGGVVVAGTLSLVVNLKFDRNLKKNRRILEQYRGRRVFIVDGLATPCLFGLFHPCICLTPEAAEDQTAKAHILAHEYTHFRQGDHIWALLRGICLALHWYNPLVWTAAVLSRRDCELSCDEGAVRLLGEACRADYGRTLVDLVSRRTATADLARCATTMTGGKSALKERVALLVKRPRTTAVMAVTVAAACIGFAVCTFTGAAEAERPDLPALDELSDNTETYLLLTELPEEDIAVYHVQGENKELIRYRKQLQWIDSVWAGETPPELYFQDLDCDGEMELAVIDRDTSRLFVYEWDGQKWTGYEAHAEQAVMDDFNAERTLTLSLSTGAAELGFKGSTVLIDMDAAYGDLDWRGGTSAVCRLSSYSYDVRRSGIYLHFYGGIQAGDGVYYQDLFHFLYTIDVIYQDGVFTADYSGMSTGLSTPYPYFAVTPVFRDILRDFIAECRDTQRQDISGDWFAICDINGDGRDELITVRNCASMSEQAERVYDADGNELLAAYPLMTYYDNGYAAAGWSHNQGTAGNKLWPYTLYKFNTNTGGYDRIASVDGWDKELGDTYESFNPDNMGTIRFPDDVDKDGDGFVYYIIPEDGGYAPAYGTPVDYAGWAEWAAAYSDGNVVHVHYQSLSKENIALIEARRRP